jgi:hypothetical protein
MDRFKAENCSSSQEHITTKLIIVNNFILWCLFGSREPSRERKVFIVEKQQQKDNLEIRRAYNRRYAANYRRNSPEKRRANELRYYARRLIAAGYTVTEPAAKATAAN